MKDILVLIIIALILIASVVSIVIAVMNIIGEIRDLKKIETQIDNILGEMTLIVENIKQATCIATTEIIEDTPDYDNMKLSELTKIAKEKKVDRYYDLNKKDLIKAIKESE